jgi:hypothetical protein
MTNVKIIFDSALLDNKKKRNFEALLFIGGFSIV